MRVRLQNVDCIVQRVKQLKCCTSISRHRWWYRAASASWRRRWWSSWSSVCVRRSIPVETTPGFRPPWCRLHRDRPASGIVPPTVRRRDWRKSGPNSARLAMTSRTRGARCCRLASEETPVNDPKLDWRNDGDSSCCVLWSNLSASSLILRLQYLAVLHRRI